MRRQDYFPYISSSPGRNRPTTNYYLISSSSPGHSSLNEDYYLVISSSPGHSSLNEGVLEAIQKPASKKERLEQFRSIWSMDRSEAIARVVRSSINFIDLSLISLSLSDIYAIAYVANMTVSLRSLNLHGCQLQERSLIALKSKLIPISIKIDKFCVTGNPNLNFDDLKAGMDICIKCGSIYKYDNKFLSRKHLRRLRLYEKGVKILKHYLYGSIELINDPLPPQEHADFQRGGPTADKALKLKKSFKKRKVLTKREKVQKFCGKTSGSDLSKSKHCISDFSRILPSSIDEKGKTGVTREHLSTDEQNVVKTELWERTSSAESIFDQRQGFSANELNTETKTKKTLRQSSSTDRVNTDMTSTQKHQLNVADDPFVLSLSNQEQLSTNEQHVEKTEIWKHTLESTLGQGQSSSANGSKIEMKGIREHELDNADDSSVHLISSQADEEKHSQRKKKSVEPRTTRDSVMVRGIKRHQQITKELEAKGELLPTTSKYPLKTLEMLASTVIVKSSKGDSGYKSCSRSGSIMSDKASMRRYAVWNEREEQEDVGYGDERMSTKRGSLEKIEEVQSSSEKQSGEDTKRSEASSRPKMESPAWDPLRVAWQKFEMTCRGLGAIELSAKERVHNWLEKGFQQVQPDDNLMNEKMMELKFSKLDISDSSSSSSISACSSCRSSGHIDNDRTGDEISQSIIDQENFEYGFQKIEKKKAISVSGGRISIDGCYIDFSKKSFDKDTDVTLSLDMDYRTVEIPVNSTPITPIVGVDYEGKLNLEAAINIPSWYRPKCDFEDVKIYKSVKNHHDSKSKRFLFDLDAKLYHGYVTFTSKHFCKRFAATSTSGLQNGSISLAHALVYNECSFKVIVCFSNPPRLLKQKLHLCGKQGYKEIDRGGFELSQNSTKIELKSLYPDLYKFKPESEEINVNDLHKIKVAGNRLQNTIDIDCVLIPIPERPDVHLKYTVNGNKPKMFCPRLTPVPVATTQNVVKGLTAKTVLMHGSQDHTTRIRTNETAATGDAMKTLADVETLQNETQRPTGQQPSQTNNKRQSAINDGNLRPTDVAALKNAIAAGGNININSNTAMFSVLIVIIAVLVFAVLFLLQKLGH